MRQSFLNRVRVLPQYVIPQHLLSRLIYKISRWRWKPFKNALIKVFIRVFRVNLDIAAESEVEQYPDFNAFFTRALAPLARPISRSATDIISPVDGTVSQIGTIHDQQLIQAKGRNYRLSELLVNNADTSRGFDEGQFATLYLAPRDYHRIHMPFDGTLKKMIYVPGRLFAVNQHTTEVVDRLFARNERLICYFDTAIGQMAIVFVGAIFVSSMETVWAGQITPGNKRTITTTTYDVPGNPLVYRKGDEIGRFNMGSTVIVICEKDHMQWLHRFKPGDRVKVGMTIGKVEGP